MGETFILDDLLNTLIELEGIGSRFYYNFAVNTEDGELKKLLMDLSEAEKKHERFYKELKKRISFNEDLCLDGEYGKYVKSLIQNVFILNNEEIEIRNMKETFKIAEELERDTILFVTELSKIIINKKEIESILFEEEKHLEKILYYKNEKGIV